MSYCRFSSDNYKSDVYVYPDTGGGYTTHVAARSKDGVEYAERPFCGRSFYHQTLDECINQLKTLKDLGYHIPDGVIQKLELEAEV